MRANARGTLVQEEQAASSSAAARDRQAIEGKQLVEQCKEELEKLEKQIFQVGKTPAKQEAEEQQEEGNAQAESLEEPEPHPLEALTEVFQLLKQATGACMCAIYRLNNNDPYEKNCRGYR